MMKKLTTLVVAMLFTAGMAFAQSNESNVNQTGNNDEVTIDQIGDFNKALISQSGNFNEATAYMNQQGTENLMNLSQFGAGDHEATLNQIGTGNRIDGSGTYNPGTQRSVQRGAGDHLANVTQDGMNNRLTFNQRGGDYGDLLIVLQGGNDNAADVLQRDAGGHVVDIIQTGNFNSIDLQQRGTGHVATFNQDGNTNQALVQQNN